MKKIIIILFIIITCLAAYKLGVVNTNNDTIDSDANEQNTDNATYKYQYIKQDGLYIIAFKDENLNLKSRDAFDENFEEYVNSNNYVIAINAGYFTSEFTHAGLLIVNGETISDIALSDTQVTHIFDLDNFIVYSVDEYLKPENQPLNAFQSGPLVLKNNVIQEDLINNSMNGRDKYLRSFIGYDDKGNKFVGVSILKISLKDLGNKIKTLEYFTDANVTLLNLDGGSSVALYSKENEEFRIGESKILPFILGIKANY